MKANSITIIVNEKEIFLRVGEKISRGGEDVDVVVDSIKTFFNKITIKFSDGERFIYKGFPFISGNK